MRHRFYFSLFLLLSLTTTWAQTLKGTLRGTVITADGQPAAFVNVVIKGTSRGNTTDERGQFVIKNVPVGSQTLSISLIGYQPLEQVAQVAPGETASVRITLTETAKQLQEVIVRNEKELKPTSMQLNRIPINYLEDVQTYSVATKETMREIGATDFQTALRVVPGLASANTDNYGFVTAYLRGFPTQASFRNGITIRSLGGEIQNVERLEVLRGPSSTLFGNSGSYGGIINKVTKTAFDGIYVGGSLSAGSFGLLRAGADVNVVLSKENNVYFRLNTLYQNEDAWQNSGAQRTDIQVAPVLVYKPAEKLSLKLEAELNSSNYPSTFYFSSAGLNLSKPRSIQDIGLKYNRYYSDISFTQARPVVQNFFAAQARYEFNPNWTLTVDAQKTVYNHDNGTITPEFYQDTLMIRDWYDFNYHWNISNYQANLNGQFSVGSVKNNLLVGLNAYSNSISGIGKYSDATSARLDTVNLRPNVVSALDASVIRGGKFPSFTFQSAFQSYAIYVANQIDLTNRLHLMLALRYDYYKDKTNQVNQSTDEDWTQGAFSPKLGAVYELAKDKLSVFINYTTAFSNVVHTPFQRFKPERAIQREAGVKVQLARNVTSTVSYYDIAVQNKVRPDPNNPNRSLQDGTRTSTGIDAEIVAVPVKGWSIITGYGYNQSAIVKSGDAALDGKRAAGTAPNSATLWTTYTLQRTSLKGLGIGLGCSHYGQAYFNDQNTLLIPAYTVLNASLFYNADTWRIGANFNNLTSQQYWTVTGTPQKPFNALVSLSMSI